MFYGSNAGASSLGFKTYPFVASMAIDVSQQNAFQVTLTGALSFGNFLNPVGDGHTVLMRFIQDGTGTRLLTLAGNKFALGATITDVTLSTAANAIDYLGFLYDLAADKWHVVSKAYGF